MHTNDIIANIDSQGFLEHFDDWNEKIAIHIAATDGLTLNAIHWDIIYFIRTFYTEFQALPKIRTLINVVLLKYGKDKGNSRYLIKLFPHGSVAQQISKIAGLPQPTNCL